MHTLFKVSLLLILTTCFIGCAGMLMPSKEEMAHMDYGQPLTIDYKPIIESYFSKALIDPYSAHIEFSGPPRQLLLQEPPLLGGKRYVGYAVQTWVNAKNRMGGYTGAKPYVFIFRDNVLIKVATPDELYNPTTGTYRDVWQ